MSCYMEISRGFHSAHNGFPFDHNVIVTALEASRAFRQCEDMPGKSTFQQQRIGENEGWPRGVETCHREGGRHVWMFAHRPPRVVVRRRRR